MVTYNLTMGTLMLSRGNGLSSGGREKGRGMWKGGMVGGRERDVEMGDGGREGEGCGKGGMVGGREKDGERGGGWGGGGEGKKGGGDYFNFFQPCQGMKMSLKR